MNRKALIAITALSAAVFAAPAMAQMRMPSMSSAYIGGSLGQSKFKVDCGGCDTKNALTWGLGVQYDVMRNLGLRGEFQRYKVDAGSAGSVNIDVLSVGALWRFQ